jgi:hypothetical protein
MKHLILSVFALFSLNVILFPAPAAAQDVVRVTVPFDFIISGVTYPAGAYNVSRLPPGPAIVFRSADNLTGVMALTNGPAEIRQYQSLLRFNRYGEQYFLSQLQNDGRRWTFPPSQAEKELIAKGSARKTQSVVASTK